MGSINRFDLANLIEEYNIDFFFETGTWKGDGVAYSSKLPFKKLFSCEIIEEIYNKAVVRFKNENNISVFHGSSEEALYKLNDQIKGNCIFWLDAHYPGAEEGIHSYNEFEKENVRLPLHTELDIIRKLRPNYNDVIIVDDLRIYEHGPFKNGNMPDSILPPAIRNINFAYDLFSDTHEIIKLYQDHGYIVIVPKKKLKEIKDSLLSKFIKKNIRRFVYP